MQVKVPADLCGEVEELAEYTDRPEAQQAVKVVPRPGEEEDTSDDDETGIMLLAPGFCAVCGETRVAGDSDAKAPAQSSGRLQSTPCSISSRYRSMANMRGDCVAVVEVGSRPEAMRLACHLLVGGTPADLPEDWQSPAFLGDPSPASEFAHCASELAAVSSAEIPFGPEHTKRRFHEDMVKHHNIGPRAVPCQKAGQKERKTMRIPDWADVTMVGSPCLAIMMARAPKVLSTQVCLRSARPQLLQR